MSLIIPGTSINIEVGDLRRKPTDAQRRPRGHVCAACKKMRTRCDPPDDKSAGPCRRCVRLGLWCQQQSSAPLLPPGTTIRGGGYPIVQQSGFGIPALRFVQEQWQGVPNVLPPPQQPAQQQPTPQEALPVPLEKLQGRHLVAAARRDFSAMTHCLLLTGASGECPPRGSVACCGIEMIGGAERRRIVGEIPTSSSMLGFISLTRSFSLSRALSLLRNRGVALPPLPVPVSFVYSLPPCPRCVSFVHTGYALESVAQNLYVNTLAAARQRFSPELLAATAVFEREHTVDGVAPSLLINHYAGGALSYLVNEVRSPMCLCVHVLGAGVKSYISVTRARNFSWFLSLGC